MQVAKWGNSLAVRLPQAVVEALKLEEGDDIEITVAGMRKFEVGRYLYKMHTLSLKVGNGADQLRVKDGRCLVD